MTWEKKITQEKRGGGRKKGGRGISISTE